MVGGCLLKNMIAMFAADRVGWRMADPERGTWRKGPTEVRKGEGEKKFPFARSSTSFLHPSVRPCTTKRQRKKATRQQDNMADPVVADNVQKLFSRPLSDFEAFMPPKVNANQYLLDGQLVDWEGPTQAVESCVCVTNPETGVAERVNLGSIHRIDSETALRLLDGAYNAYDLGRGQWPRSSVGNVCIPPFLPSFLPSFLSTSFQLPSFIHSFILQFIHSAIHSLIRSLTNNDAEDSSHKELFDTNGGGERGRGAPSDVGDRKEP